MDHNANLRHFNLEEKKPPTNLAFPKAKSQRHRNSLTKTSTTIYDQNVTKFRTKQNRRLRFSR